MRWTPLRLGVRRRPNLAAIHKDDPISIKSQLHGHMIGGCVGIRFSPCHEGWYHSVFEGLRLNSELSLLDGLPTMAIELHLSWIFFFRLCSRWVNLVSSSAYSAVENIQRGCWTTACVLGPVCRHTGTVRHTSVFTIAPLARTSLSVMGGPDRVFPPIRTHPHVLGTVKFWEVSSDGIA